MELLNSDQFDKNVEMELKKEQNDEMAAVKLYSYTGRHRVQILVIIPQTLVTYLGYYHISRTHSSIIPDFILLIIDK